MNDAIMAAKTCPMKSVLGRHRTHSQSINQLVIMYLYLVHLLLYLLLAFKYFMKLSSSIEVHETMMY